MYQGNYLDGTKNLIRHGFLTKKGKEIFKGLDPEEVEEKFNDLSVEEIEACADEHVVELQSRQMVRTGYPKPTTDQNYHLIYETFQKPIESFYFWALNHLGDLGFPKIIKVTDIFAASEQSSFFGSSQQRLGLSQDKVVSFLVNIGRLVKELFQIVREVRIIEERLEYYDKALSEDKETQEAAEISLKALFVELVEGGAKNINSVYGLARELQFTTLPDLFFSIHPKNEKEIDEKINALEFNRKVKEVLKKKLFQYLIWRRQTYTELKNRKSHTISYLKQHYDAIQLYLTWVKPYLKHIRRLSMDQRKLDLPHMVAAFEGSMVEIELLALQLPPGNKSHYIVIMQNMTYRTSPQMPFQQEYQRGPLHMGKMELQLRSYMWDQRQIDAYMKMRQSEGLEMLGDIDDSIKKSMEALGDDLKRYLEQKEAFGKKKDKKKKEDGPVSIPAQWKASYDDWKKEWKELVGPVGGIYGKVKDLVTLQSEAEKKAAKVGKELKWGFLAKILCWTHYKNFKKAHRLVTW